MKLFWTDLEMTGLDVNKEVIIEVAVLITDKNLEVITDYHSVVKQPQSYIDAMDDWNKKHHGSSGLTELVPSGNEPSVVEAELISLANKYYDKKDRIILAGNSIGQDRLFIDKYFKTFSERLHYRMVDVSSFKVVFNNFYQISYAKPQTQHRASDDIKESINEFKKYLSYIKVPN